MATGMSRVTFRSFVKNTPNENKLAVYPITDHFCLFGMPGVTPRI